MGQLTMAAVKTNGSSTVATISCRWLLGAGDKKSTETICHRAGPQLQLPVARPGDILSPDDISSPVWTRLKSVHQTATAQRPCRLRPTVWH